MKRAKTFNSSLLSVMMVAVVILSGCSSGSSSDSVAKDAVDVNGFSISIDENAAKALPAKYAEGLNIVTSAPYPPFEDFDADGNLIGLDIDLGNMIAARLGTTAKWTSIDYNGVIPALQAAKFDMVLASIGDTPEREKALDFVNYSLQGQIIIVPKGNPNGITGLESMCGKVMSVEAGNINAGYFDPLTKYCAAQGKKNMTLKELPKTSDALLAVKSGSSAGVYIGVATAADLMSKPEGANFEIVVPAGKPNGYIPRYVGVGLPKNTPELRDAVKLALEGLLADGTILKLYTKYGQELIVTDKITVNNVDEVPLL